MKIPENANPYRAIVNGVEHAYEAGEETTVADGVEELINAADNFPPAAEEVKPPFAGGGGDGGVLVVHEGDYGVLDKTWQEIRDASDSSVVIMYNHGYVYYLARAFSQIPIGSQEGTWIVFFSDISDGEAVRLRYVTSDGPDSYPVFVDA